MTDRKDCTICANRADDGEYVAEIRFGVVMYGGVSLAIYINGVTNELFEMARATPRPGAPPMAPPTSGSTTEIFRVISYLCSNPTLREEYAQRLRNGQPVADLEHDMEGKYDRTRFVVDVISGTSAGGINGIFLAKALANGKDFSVLKDLWIHEGDIGLLLNDSRSYAGLGNIKRPPHPASLLNSDRMYLKLLGAMDKMDSPPSAATSPYVDELDLFVTTTDIVGTAVPLRLFDKVVHERRHKQSYHFRYGCGHAGNDLDAGNNPFLAFAARCTSAFPFAFEPMTLTTLQRLAAAKLDNGGTRKWNRFFPNLDKDEVKNNEHVNRAFGDGGYLDNKPFSYVVDALSQRSANLPIERKLLYVEPAPKELEAGGLKPDPDNPPDALTNAVAALTSIPLHETIREDLQAVLKRNRRIERVERIVRLGECDIERHLEQHPAGGAHQDWAALTMADQAALHGAAFIPYLRLRATAVTDMIADSLAEQWEIDTGSDHHYALRALVRVWRENHFVDDGTRRKDAGGPPADSGKRTINAFLSSYDLDYRLRRIDLLLRKTDQLMTLWRKYRNAARPDDVVPSESDARLLELIPEEFDPRRSEGHAGICPMLVAAKAFKTNVLATRDLLARQRCLRGAGSKAETDPQLRGQLLVILDLILGQALPDPDRLAADRDKSRELVAFVRVLKQTLDSYAAQGDTTAHAGGQPTAGSALGPGKLSSASRTLQEIVFMRASRLLEAAGKVPESGLERALEQGIEAMALDIDPGRPEGLGHVAGRVWKLLGEPKETVRDGNWAATPTVHDVATGAGMPTAEELGHLNGGPGTALRILLGRYYLRFDEFDQISFPLYFDTQTGEPATVEVVRVSPVDAVNLIDEHRDRLDREKLTGTALANFGAFLDERWRRNDAMWGRLDGVERLIHVLLPWPDDDTVMIRKALMERAHGTILRTELLEHGHGKLAQLFCDVIKEMPPGSGRKEVDWLFAKLELRSTGGQARMETILASILDEQGLLNYVRTTRDVDRQPAPAPTMDNAARAVRVTCRLLEGIASRQGKGDTMPRWIARMGLFLQGIVAVAVPGTLKYHLIRHWGKLLYAFEAFLLILSIVLGNMETRKLALVALGATLTVHLFTMIAGDMLKVRSRWPRAALALPVLALIALALVGLRHVHEYEPFVTVCAWWPGAC